MTLQDDLLQAAKQAALAAAHAIQIQRQQPRQIISKGHLDIVTDADLAANEAILNLLHQQYPDHAILSEESEAAKALDLWQPGESIWWCIDPIDGTTNFARNSPLWSISIAAIQDGQVLAGVVYDPSRGDMFSASWGGGAFLNDQPIHSTDTELQWAMISADWPVHPPKRQQMIQRVSQLLPHVRSLRSMGTTALALSHLAAGYLDAYLQGNFKAWDVAAGALILHEAGGVVSTLEGEAWTIFSPSLLGCSSPRLHAELLTYMQPTA
jgi:myo-inositol-1(or 4)-monophosphatase